MFILFTLLIGYFTSSTIDMATKQRGTRCIHTPLVGIFTLFTLLISYCTGTIDLATNMEGTCFVHTLQFFYSYLSFYVTNHLIYRYYCYKHPQKQRGDALSEFFHSFYVTNHNLRNLLVNMATNGGDASCTHP